MIIKIFFIASFLFFFALLTGILYFYRHKNRFIREKSVMISTWTMVFYIISAIAILPFVDNFVKMIVLICAISPFIIGYYSTYKKLMLFTILQLLLIVVGIISVI